MGEIDEPPQPTADPLPVHSTETVAPGDPISVRRGAVSETLSFELENTDVVLPWNIGTGPTVLGRADGIQLSLMVTEHPKQRGVLEGKVFVNGGAVGVLSILIQPDGTLRFDLVESLRPAMSGKQILLSKDQIVGALRRWEQAHNEVVQTKNREGSAPARRDPESGMANIQGPFGDLVELIVAGARKLFGRRAAQTKAEPAPSSRPPLPRNIVEGIEGLIFGTRLRKKAESPALPAALKQRDPIGLLMALAEHPDVAWLPEREIREGDENLRVVAEVQRRSPEFHHLLAELVRLGLEQIETGDRRVTEDQLKALAGRAGLSQAGKHKDPRLPSRRQRLEARLTHFGFHRHGDWLATLKTVLENPKYVMEPAGTDHAMVKLDPLYEELVSDLVSQIEMIRTRGGRENLMGVQMELTPLLNPHGFDSSGRRIRFPKTKAFFERHLPDQKFEPNRPEDMLSMLAYPDADWHGTKIDAVGKEGWAEAVRELAEAVIPEYLEKPKIGRMGRPWFAFGEIPRLQLTPIVDRELARLLEGSREAIEARLERWKQEGANGSQGADQTGEDRGTQFMAYHRGVRGGRSSDLFGKIEQGERGFEWLAHHALKGAIGRFYIGVRAEHAEAFRKAFQEEVLNPALKEGLKFSAKIANDPRRLEAAGDATVVYFQARDQRIFYAQLAAFIRHHEGKGWFHTLEMDRRPILAAQILDPEGRPVAGLSFGQEVPGGYQSFNELRANAVTRALRNERLLDALGLLGDLNAEGREALRKNLILWELQRAGVDIENPAFQRDGMKIFGDIFEHTDQGFAQSGQTPPRGTKAEVPSPASSPAGAADFRRARLLNERILTGDAAAVLEAKAYYHQETESMGVNAGPMRIAINAYVDPQSGLITAVGNTQEIPSEIRQRSAGVTFTVVQLFADLSLIQAVEAAGVRLRFGDRVSVVSLEEGAQEKLLSLVEDLGRRAKVSPKIMIQVRRAIEESRTDPSRLEPVFNGMIEKVALAKGMTPEAQGILQGLRGLAFFSVRDRSGAGWRVLDGREVKPPEVADLAQQLLDSVENEALKKTMERQWQSVWRERCKSGEDLGGWLADVFGQFYMTLEAFGSRGDQPEVVAPVRELVGIIETVRAQGIEVKIAERIWEKTVQIINRNKPEAGNQAALAHLPSDFAQKIYEGVRDPELRRVMEVQWPKKELTNERVSLTNGRLGGWLRDVFGHIATQTMHGEGEDKTKAVAAMTELVPIIERVLSEGITLPLWDPALLEEAKRIVAGGS